MAKKPAKGSGKPLPEIEINLEELNKDQYLFQEHHGFCFIISITFNTIDI